MKRSKTLDLIRGLIMVLMALDHASAFVARQHFTEIWGITSEVYPSTLWWLTRFLSHLCAPGFFFLMGIGMYLFAIKRQTMGWDSGRITKYFLKRGGVILLLMILLEFPAWMFGMSFSQMPVGDQSEMIPGLNDGGFAFPTTVLYALGACMILASVLWNLSKTLLAIVSLGCFVVSGLYVAQQSAVDTFTTIETLVLVPNISNYVMTIYPIIPWLGVTTGGIFWARFYQEDQLKTIDYSLYVGILFLVVFSVLKYFQLGNFDYTSNTNIETIFTLVKYPPSAQFILTTIGILLLLIYILDKIQELKILHPILIFGQTAMFFYLLHLYLYGAIGAMYPLGTGIFNLYLWWGVGLVPLYFLCRFYLNFKRKTAADSLWRML